MGTKKYAYINPEMLKWARSETPFSTIEDVIVRRPKYTCEQIKAWENGEEPISITEAKDLASLYDVPFACLYFTNIPQKKPRPYTDRRTAYGRVLDGMSYELWREIRRITSNREIALDTAADFFAGVEPLPSISLDESISSVAKKIRNFLDVQTPFKFKSIYKNNAFNYFRTKFESKGIMVAQMAGVSVSEVRGLSIYNDVMPIIAANSNDWEKAKVFTLFHELVHLLRRSSSICLIDFNEKNDDEEKLCDRIAAEALLPETLFRHSVTEMNKDNNEWDDTSLITIADKYAISTVVVLRRLYDLKIIDYNYYILRYKEMELAVKEYAKTPKSFPVEYHYKYLNQQGHLFPRVMLSAYSNGLISYGEMCRSLNIKTMHVGNVEQAVMFK